MGPHAPARPMNDLASGRTPPARLPSERRPAHPAYGNPVAPKSHRHGLWSCRAVRQACSGLRHTLVVICVDCGNDRGERSHERSEVLAVKVVLAVQPSREPGAPRPGQCPHQGHGSSRLRDTATPRRRSRRGSADASTGVRQDAARAQRRVRDARLRRVTLQPCDCERLGARARRARQQRLLGLPRGNLVRAGLYLTADHHELRGRETGIPLDAAQRLEPSARLIEPLRRQRLLADVVGGERLRN